VIFTLALIVAVQPAKETQRTQRKNFIGDIFSNKITKFFRNSYQVISKK